MATTGTDKVNITGKELRDIMAEYAFDDDIMNEESQKVRLAKMAVSRLSEPDRIIWCLYMDKESSREVGRILSCSHSTVLKQLQKIKKDIMYHIMVLSKTEPMD